MPYKPKIVTGKVTGTGWPIDGHVLYFSQWDYDKHQSFHLYGWEDEDDEAVMLTMYQNEEIGTSLRAFTEKWKAKEWEPQGAFCLPLDKVEVQEVKQEEEKDDAWIIRQAKAAGVWKKQPTDSDGSVGTVGTPVNMEK